MTPHIDFQTDKINSLIKNCAKCIFQKQSKELICTAILKPSIKTLNADLGVVTSPDPGKEVPEQIDSNRESEPPSPSKHPTNPLKQIIEKMEKIKSKKKPPDFGVTAFPIPLQWIEAVREGEVCAEILCSAELIQVSSHFG